MVQCQVLFSGVLLKDKKRTPTPDTWSGMRVNSIIIKSFGIKLR
jgi:hypothetical protein